MPDLRVAFWGSGSVDDYYRAVLPNRALIRGGLVASGTFERASVEPLTPPSADVVVLHRNTAPLVRDAVAAIPDDCLLVCDDDDDFEGAVFLRAPMLWDQCPLEIPWEPPVVGESALDYYERLVLWFFWQHWHTRGSDRPPWHKTRAELLSENLFSVLVDALGSAPSFKAAVTWCLSQTSRAVYQDTMKLADVVTVSTPTLADRVRPLNHRVEVVPNCLDLTQPCWERRHAPHELITIGWTGGHARIADLEVCKPALVRVLQEYDGTHGRPRVGLSIGGSPDSFFMLLWDADLQGMDEWIAQLRELGASMDLPLAQGFTTVTSPCGRWTWHAGTRDVDAVPGMYATVDLGIVPCTVGTLTNNSKSDIKGLEQAGMGIPSICSPIPAYKLWRTEGTGAIVLPDNDERSWYEALARLIDDAELRRRLGEEALSWAQTRSIDLWAPEWLRVYEMGLSRSLVPRRRRAERIAWYRQATASAIMGSLRPPPVPWLPDPSFRPDQLTWPPE